MLRPSWCPSDISYSALNLCLSMPAGCESADCCGGRKWYWYLWEWMRDSNWAFKFMRCWSTLPGRFSASAWQILATLLNPRPLTYIINQFHKKYAQSYSCFTESGHYLSSECFLADMKVESNTIWDSNQQCKYCTNISFTSMVSSSSDP